MSTDPLLGQLIGSHRVTEQIGQGGMGRIYLAVHPGIGARVAIKVLAPDRARDITEIERFFAEARVVNVIHHESIVNILDLRVLDDGSPCIVMEHLDGASLAQLIATRGALPAAEVCALALEVLAALGAAHDKGIIHRDLTPANIFVTKGGHAKVLDFGIAKLLTRAAGSGPTLAGQMIGTPAYVSPEQIRGASDIDGRADLYALGAVMFEALTGKPPFTADTAFDLLRAHEQTLPTAPRVLARDIPQHVDEVVLRALEKDPRMRFANASEMSDALMRAQAPRGADEPIPDTVPAAYAAKTMDPLAPTQSPTRARTPRTGTTASLMAMSEPKVKRGAIVRTGTMAIGLGAIVTTLIIVGFAISSAVRARAAGTATPASVTEDVLPVADPTRFDPSAFLPEAKRMAEARVSGVTLVELNMSPVDTHGLVNVADPMGGGEAMYAFRGMKEGAPIGVFVVVTAGQVRSFLGPNNHIDVPFPRCTMREVLTAANLTDGYAQVGYSRVANTPENPWTVTSTNGTVSRTLPDNCPGPRAY